MKLNQTFSRFVANYRKKSSEKEVLTNQTIQQFTHGLGEKQKELMQSLKQAMEYFSLSFYLF